MATNQTFDDLIVRIDTATTTLENATQAVNDGSKDIEEAVVEAKSASATATAEAQRATTQASTATIQANKATAEANKAVTAVDEAKALAPFQEAPKDSQTYGRKDGVWTVVGSSGGVGTVTSVNFRKPDAQGNVILSIPPAQVQSDWTATSGLGVILNKPTLFSGSYTDLTNKPAIPTVPTQVSAFSNDAGYVSDAPSDGEQYARSNGDWVKVEASGSGGGYAVTETYYLGDDEYAQWVNANPYEPIKLSLVGGYVSGRWKAGEEILTLAALESFPSGDYWFESGDITTAPLAGQKGVIEVRKAPTTANPKAKTATAIVNSATGVATKYTLLNSGSWVVASTQPTVKVGSESFGVSSSLESLNIPETLVGMLWSGAMGTTTLLSKTNSATAYHTLPTGLYRITDDAQIGGTSASSPFIGRQVILLVIDFQSAVNVKRTGTTNKSVLAMSWLGTTGTDIKFHILTGDKTWITK